MEYSYRGVPERGIVLIAPDSSSFAPLAGKIRSHAGQADLGLLDSLPAGELACAAILVNLAEKPIVSLAWQWRLEGPDGRLQPAGVRRLTAEHWLVPLGGPPRNESAYRYASMILPNSKRLIVSMQMIGGNHDVRAPEPGEIQTGGCFSFGRNVTPISGWRLSKLTLEIDGVFFEDGEFVGANAFGLWEMVWCKAEVVSEAARIARASREAGLRAEDILPEVERFTGPPPERRERAPAPPHLRVDIESQKEYERAYLASWMEWNSSHRGSEATVSSLAAWLDQPRPNLRRSP